MTRRGSEYKKNSDLREAVALISSANAHKKEKIKRFFVPTDEKKQNELGDDLMDWSDLEESKRIDQFPLSRGLSPYKFHDITKHNSYFKECYEYALSRIADRMERLVEKDPAYIMKALPYYSRLWIEAEERKLAATKNSDMPAVINVTMPNFGEVKKD